MDSVVYAGIKYDITDEDGMVVLVSGEAGRIPTGIPAGEVTLMGLYHVLAQGCPHPIDSISLARVETKTNCKGEPFEKKVYYCEQCGAEFSL